MVISYKTGNLLVDGIELQAQLLCDKIADIIEEVYAREINRLVYDELGKHCEGCKLDDPSQLHHECLTMDVYTYQYIKTSI